MVRLLPPSPMRPWEEIRPVDGAGCQSRKPKKRRDSTDLCLKNGRLTAQRLGGVSTFNGRRDTSCVPCSRKYRIPPDSVCDARRLQCGLLVALVIISFRSTCGCSGLTEGYVSEKVASFSSRVERDKLDSFGLKPRGNCQRGGGGFRSKLHCDLRRSS